MTKVGKLVLGMLFAISIFYIFYPFEKGTVIRPVDSGLEAELFGAISKTFSSGKGGDVLQQFLGRNYGTKWSHFCVYGTYGREALVVEYAEKNKFDVGVISLESHFDQIPQWSIVLLADKESLQIIFSGKCIEQRDLNAHCATVKRGKVNFEPDVASKFCPYGTYIISAPSEGE